MSAPDAANAPSGLAFGPYSYVYCPARNVPAARPIPAAKKASETQTPTRHAHDTGAMITAARKEATDSAPSRTVAAPAPTWVIEGGSDPRHPRPGRAGMYTPVVGELAVGVASEVDESYWFMPRFVKNLSGDPDTGIGVYWLFPPRDKHTSGEEVQLGVGCDFGAGNFAR